MLDNDQYTVDSIIAYRGDPDQRTSMEFEVRFSGSTVVWKPWDKDLDTTQKYEDFIRIGQHLLHCFTQKRSQTDIG